MIERHPSVDPFRFEGESLRYMFKDQIEIAEVSNSENKMFQHCKMEYPFPNLQISFVLANNYPLACARVAVHHKACKVNIPYILRSHTDWSNRICAHTACCQDLEDIQVFLQGVAERFTGTFSLMAAILTAKRDIQYTNNEGFSIRSNIRGDGCSKAEKKGDIEERSNVNNPLSFLPCTQENFMTWQASFLAEASADEGDHSDWRRSKPVLQNKCTGKEYFELNVDTKEVDWDLFKDSGSNEI